MAAVSTRGTLVTPASYHACKAVIDGVDHLATEMEAKWGVGRLRLLVDDLLRERFDRQLRKWNDAIFSYELEDIRRHGEAVRKGWLALDAAATAAGKQPIAPHVWEVAMSDGRVAAFVQTNAEASKVARDGRYVVVFTLAEVARMLEHNTEVVKAKDVFPGALVTEVRSKEPPIDWDHGDAIPF